jgi:hypothetical protein
MTVYEQMSAFRTASAAVGGDAVIALAVALAWAMRRMEMIPPARRARPFPLGRAAGRRPAPSASLVWTPPRSRPPRSSRAGPDRSSRRLSMNLDAVAWSAGLAAATALLLVAWSLLSTRRSRLEPLWLATLALPGVVAGLGALQLAGRTGALPGWRRAAPAAPAP